MTARHRDEYPHAERDREWMTLLSGTADGALTTTAIPQVPTAPIPSLTVDPEAPPADQSWLAVESIRGPRRARRVPASVATLAGLALGVALSEPLRALGHILTDLARDLTGGT